MRRSFGGYWGWLLADLNTEQNKKGTHTLQKWLNRTFLKYCSSFLTYFIACITPWTLCFFFSLLLHAASGVAVIPGDLLRRSTVTACLSMTHLLFWGFGPAVFLSQGPHGQHLSPWMNRLFSFFESTLGLFHRSSDVVRKRKDCLLFPKSTQQLGKHSKIVCQEFLWFTVDF